MRTCATTRPGGSVVMGGEHRRREIVGLIAAMALVLLAYREVAFAGTPYQGAGAPLAANAQSAVFDPLTLAVNLHPTPLTWDLSFLVVFLLGAAATYLFLRSLGLSLLASLAGTTAFVMSGYFATGNNLPFVRLYFYVPVLLWLADKVIASGRIRWVAAFG